MAFPVNPTVGQRYTSEKGIVYQFSPKEAWEMVATEGGAIKFTISDNPPLEPQFGDQWWDTTNSTLKSWASDGDSYFWEAIGDQNGGAPIVSPTPPQNPTIGLGWFFKGTLYLYLKINGVNQWVPVTANFDVNRAMPLAWYYAEEAFAFELFGNNDEYTWRGMTATKITSTTQGDDTIDVEDTTELEPDRDYVIVNAAGDFVDTVTVLSVLGATRFRAKTPINYTIEAANNYYLSRTSFDVSVPGQATVKNGDVLYSRPLTSLRQRGGNAYIRRTANGVGIFSVKYRERDTTTWFDAPFKGSFNVENDDTVRDEIYEIDLTGIVECVVSFQANEGVTDTVYHLVLGTAPQSIENSRVYKPTNVSPADQAVNITATPTLVLDTYRSLYNIAQGGAEFRVAEDEDMDNLVYSTSTDFLAGWTNIAGQTGTWTDALLYDGLNGVVVGGTAAVKKTTDGGKTYTAGGTPTQAVTKAAYTDGRLILVGAAGYLAYSDNGGTTLNVVTAPDAYADTFNGVAASGNYIVAVGNAGKIVRSTNKGVIWTTVTQANSYAGNFQDVVMNAQGGCIAVGANGEIQTSSDYGLNWVKRTPPASYSGTYYGVVLTNNGVSVAVGSAAAIHKSTDYGATWTTKTKATSGYSGAFRAVAIDGNYVLIGGDSGEMESSDDTGDTWIKRDLAGGSTAQINSIDIDLAKLVGLVVGATNLVQTSLRLEGVVTQVTVPAGSDLLKTGRTYWWSGRYQDAVGFWSEWSKPTAFATQANFSYVRQPSNVSPANGAINVSVTPALQASNFSNFGDADTHDTSRWQISSDQDFKNITYDSGFIANLTTHTVPTGNSLTTGGKYWWRVKYKGASGRESPYSAPSSFTAVAKPNQPTIVAPAASAINVSRNPTIQTSSYSIPTNSPPHTTTQYQISTNQTFTALVYDSGSSPDLTQHTVPSGNTLAIGTVYFVRVRHRGEGTDWSDWSAARQFTTIASGAKPTVQSFNDGRSPATPNKISYGIGGADNFLFVIDPTDWSGSAGDTLVSTQIKIAGAGGGTIYTGNLANKDSPTTVTLSGAAYPALKNETNVAVSLQHTGSLSGVTGFGTPTTVAVEQARPLQPAVTSPANGATGVSRTPTITTSSYNIPGGSPGHMSSQYQISTVNTFASVAVNSGEVGNLTSWTVPIGSQLNLNTLYYVRVRHRGDGTDWSDWSPTRQFTVLGSADKPSIDSFDNNKSPASSNTIGYNTTTNQLSFRVNPSDFNSVPGDDVSNTYLQLATTADFASILATIELPGKGGLSTITLSGSSYPALLNAETVYGRVQHVGSLSGPTGYGSATSITVEGPTGESIYTTPGTYTWVAPAGVKRVSVITIGAGGKAVRSKTGGGGGGGGLGYKNSIAVTPGASYTVIVGDGRGTSGQKSSAFGGILTAFGGADGVSNGGAGGSYVGGDGGGTGGLGGANKDRSYTQQVPDGDHGWTTVTYNRYEVGGGGGGAGYSGNGGRGADGGGNATAGTGGGAGGGGYGTDQSGNNTTGGGGGGGVGIYGAGGNGAAGGNNGDGNGAAGGPGSGAANFPGRNGGDYGGGAGGVVRTDTSAGNGAVRIIWGAGRSFPNNAA